ITSAAGVDIWLRMPSDVAPGWTTGGTINLGKNFIRSTWGLDDPYHPVPGILTGQANVVTSTVSPISSTTFAPVSGTSIVNTAQANLAAVTAYPVLYQPPTSFSTPTFGPIARPVNGTAADMGAIEF
ncbi:MAG: hypothetical protein HY019_19235, partial [Aquabacterium sp.]|uniref:hypothetical protein n=1 Tax=Aquabacterium sp. TaxID=1872578 RepID=UPI0025B8F433